ncbi:MAG TPA: histidine--tRNA ligase [Xanthomonadaceae bacterium]|nr:histidine--tRNA ligase [Xanthomonadaceae bacterium]
MIKPRTPPGVLELLPPDQIAFQAMLDTIRSAFERYGFVPVETPVMELSEVLLTKSGGETERQVYFVQSTGALEQGGTPELALRFDLTVPLARYVAEHEHALAFPFRRYQIQRVYRGERAQRGRFREFYQCDIDVIGKDTLALAYDAEMPAVINAVFEALDLGEFTIALNNRRLLRGFFEKSGIVDPERQMLVMREVDKLGKRGEGHVRETLCGSAFALPAAGVDAILAFVGTRSQGHEDALARLDALGGGNATLEQGVSELREVLERVRQFGVPDHRYALDFSIARGLDYYTGTVYETTLDAHPEIGSVCAGGRYENLAGYYSRSHLPGVGLSIGLTRLYWQLREAGLVGPADSTVQALVCQMDPAALEVYLDLGRRLREGGINTEVQLEPARLGRQLKHADRAGIRFAVIAGEDEIARGSVTVKDLRRGVQFEVAPADLARTLRVELEQSRAMQPEADSGA